MSWEKVKAWPIMKMLAAFGAALAFALSAAAVARRNSQAKALEQAALDHVQAGTTRALERAKKQTQHAENHRVAAERHRRNAEARLDELGQNDEKIADLVSAWNTSRLRN